jgi:hypothetical protein
LIVPRATIKRTSELYIFLRLQSRDDFLSVHFSQFDGPFWVAEPEIRPVANSELWIHGHEGEEKRAAAVGICTKADQRDAA